MVWIWKDLNRPIEQWILTVYLKIRIINWFKVHNIQLKSYNYYQHRRRRHHRRRRRRRFYTRQ